MNTLSVMFKETTTQLLASYMQQYIDSHWQQVWESHLPEIEQIYAKGGDSAYGFFCLKLIQPLQLEICDAGFRPNPVLPGVFPQSEEHRGPWEDRERRFWSVIYQNDIALGTLLTQVFHDHTSLRIPRPPRIYAIRETDPVHIAQAIIHSNPAESEA